MHNAFSNQPVCCSVIVSPEHYCSTSETDVTGVLLYGRVLCSILCSAEYSPATAHFYITILSLY